jgi:hypothetical protein
MDNAATSQAISAIVYLQAKIAKATVCNLPALKADIARQVAPLPDDDVAGVLIRKFLQLLEMDAPSPLRRLT